MYNADNQILYKRGFAPNPIHFFALMQKSKQKNTSPVLRTPSPRGEGKKE